MNILFLVVKPLPYRSLCANAIPSKEQANINFSLIQQAKESLFVGIENFSGALLPLRIKPDIKILLKKNPKNIL